VRERHGFGNFENPLFPGVFERAATAVGGSILAAELALGGGSRSTRPAGTHTDDTTARAASATSNDPVFAIRRLLEADVARVLYVDLDAHHGDGVQDAFLDEPGACRFDPRAGTLAVQRRRRRRGPRLRTQPAGAGGFQRQ